MRPNYICMVICCFSISISQPFTQTLHYKSIKFNSVDKTTGMRMDLNKLDDYFSFIPMQSTHLVEGKTLSVMSFYMMRFEMPNMLYRYFCEDLKRQGKTELLQRALPDSNIWFSGLEPYKEYYFDHPAYADYPVLGVSRDGIHLFCDWLNEKVKSLSIKQWKGKKIFFRLPYEIEWMVAAQGGDNNAVYAWKGPYLRRIRAMAVPANKKWITAYYANFCRIDDSQITRDTDGILLINRSSQTQIAGTLLDEILLTAPVNSYWPNGYGLYNMCGNVREMVQEEGFTKGGGWTDPGGDLQITCRNTYNRAGFPCEGFRLVAIVE